MLLANGDVRCGGANTQAQLGIGTSVPSVGRGVGETGWGLPRVEFGGPLRGSVGAVMVAAGSTHACAVLNDTARSLVCWGTNDRGELGMGLPSAVVPRWGDQPLHMGDGLPIVALGTTSPGEVVEMLSLGFQHTCVVFRGSGRCKCFGRNEAGQLCLGVAASQWGGNPGEMGDGLPFINVGTGLFVRQVAAGGVTTCFLRSDDKIVCAGDANALGLENPQQLGAFATWGRVPEQLGDGLPIVDLSDGLVETAAPSRAPTLPTLSPSKAPSSRPSKAPTGTPSEAPTKWPTEQPTAKPSKSPIATPSKAPTKQPTTKPSKSPTSKPSKAPLRQPTTKPSKSPTSKPSKAPTRQPTTKPSKAPVRAPTRRPTNTAPTRRPTTKTPTRQPAKSPWIPFG